MRAFVAARCAVLAAAVAVPAAAGRADTPGASDAEFFMSLSYKEVATLADGYRAVAMLARGSDDLKESEKCRQDLVERKIVPGSWGEASSAPLTKGRLAYMVCRALGVRGGLMMRLVGPTQRYCLFELDYLKIMQGGATYQNCTGGELVSVIDRADEYRKKQAGEKEADALEESDVGKQRPAGEEAAKPVEPKAAPAEKEDSAGKVDGGPAAGAGEKK